MNNPRLNLWWGSRDPLQADNARRLSQFVTGLPDFDPIYQSWLLSPITKENTVSVPLSETKAKELLDWQPRWPTSFSGRCQGTAARR